MKDTFPWPIVIAGAVAALALYLVWPSSLGTEAERKAVKEGRVLITYWDRHSGHEHELRRELADEFNASQDKIYVRMLPVGFRYEKMLTAIASGAPPDICSMESNSLFPMASQGCFMPLDDWLKDIPHLQKDAFFPHVYDGATVNGKVYAIPTTTDTYCLIWNKDLFRRAGLDPERPPKTLEELGEYAKILTIKDQGGIQQVGFLPWLPWDISQAYIGFFGGKVYDPVKDMCTTDGDPGTIAAYRWMSSWTIPPVDGPPAPYMLDRVQVQKFRAGFGAYQSGANPFYFGKIAMITEGEWQVTFIEKYAPNLNWGVAPIPTPEGQPARCYSPTAVVDAIPAGCRHPKEALEFLKWFHTPRADGRPSPASDYCYTIHNIPCRKEDCFQPRFINDPKFKVFIDQLLEKPVVTSPNMSAVAIYLNELDRYRDLTINGEMPPEEAATEIQKKTNEELVRFRQAAARLAS
jgi:multiple sugar transport system substrate-binding protein